MAGGGFISGPNQSTGIYGTSGKIETPIKSGGKVPVAVPAITTYKGSTSNTIKVTVDNQNRIIRADILESVLKQKGVSSVWYDAQSKWLYYDITSEDKIISKKVAQLPNITDFNILTRDVTSLQRLVNSMFDYILNSQISNEKNEDGDDCYTLVFNPFNVTVEG